MKKYLSLLTAGIMFLTLFSGCSKAKNETIEETKTTTTVTVEDSSLQSTETQAPPKSTDPIDMITDGYYTYNYSVEGYGEYTYYFKFYEEVPVLGSVFYAGFANNGSNFAGTYKVEKADIAYKCFENRDKMYAQEYSTGTAPYTVTFYDWNGSELGKCGYDGNVLYNDQTAIVAAGSEDCFYNHDTDVKESKFIKTYEGELGVKYLDFVAADDATSALTLFHNSTYLDMVGFMIEGTWTMQESSDGGYTYKLMPNDATDTSANLTVTSDKKSATYTPDGGSSIEMISSLDAAPKTAYKFSGMTTIIEYGLDANAELRLLDNGMCEFEVELMGNKSVIDTGTYSMLNDYTFEVSFEKGMHAESVMDFTTMAITLNYSGTTDIGKIDCTLTLNQDATNAEKADQSGNKEELFAFVGGYSNLVIYSDNTYKYSFVDYGVEETGTWSFDKASYAFSITQSNDNVINATLGDDFSLNVNYTAVANEALADTFTVDSATWGAALAN